MSKPKDINKKIRERLKKRLEDKISSEVAFTGSVDSLGFKETKEDTILNFIIDNTLEDAINNANVDKLIKIMKLAEDEEEWKPVETD